jgi:hypothetical protein
VLEWLISCILRFLIARNDACCLGSNVVSRKEPLGSSGKT